MATTATKKTIPKEEWEKKLSAVRLNKGDLNSLVMNYLVIEGYKDAAERFAQEAGVEPPIDLSLIKDRMDIRNYIQSGHVEQAIERVNDLDPEILDTNPKLYFHLQQQRLIELIRSGNITDALRFAQEELAPKGEEHPEYLEELEKTMLLLAFEGEASTQVSSLLDYSQRQKTASELNAAILAAQHQEKDPKLPALLKMLMWTQNQLEQKVKFPKITQLADPKLEEIDSNSNNNNNSHPM